MRFGFKKISLLILVITAFVFSRATFSFFDDLEGPNLLVVVGMASILFLVASAAYLSNLFLSLVGFKRIAAAILIQMFGATGIYLGLR